MILQPPNNSFKHFQTSYDIKQSELLTEKYKEKYKYKYEWPEYRANKTPLIN